MVIDSYNTRRINNNTSDSYMVIIEKQDYTTPMCRMK